MSTQYKIVRKLQDTLQGAVYEAQQVQSKRKVAIKVAEKSKIQQSRRAGVLEDLELEVALMSKVTSNGVIQVLDKFEDEERKYVVMEFAENGDLFSQLAKLRTFDEDSAKLYFNEIALALKDLHSKRICHLDVSLENVLISRDGTLKLCDFGVARQQEGDFISTRNGAFRPGKLMYISPEALVAEKFEGFKADVYSLGVLLFCMLYGFNPYTSDAVVKFREYYQRFHSVKTSYEFPVEEYVDYLRSIDQLSVDDLAYALILCGDAESVFELYRIKGLASEQTEAMISSMLTFQKDRITLEAVCHSCIQ
jgi:serine/threonine protein kinase